MDLLKRPVFILMVMASFLIATSIGCGSSAEPQTSESPAKVETKSVEEPVKAEKPKITGFQSSKNVVESPAVPTAVPAQSSVPVEAEGFKMDQLGIAVNTQSWDSNYSYKVNISGYLDKRPVMEWLVGVDQHTGEFIPQLATSWEMAPNGKDFTFKLREGVQYHDDWGEFGPEDVRHSVWLLHSPEAKPSGVSTWRQMFGIGKKDEQEVKDQQIVKGVEIVDDNTVTIHLDFAWPEAMYNLGYRRNLPMESKARWDSIGDSGYGDKIVGTGPFTFTERVEGEKVTYEAVEDHWRVTPEFGSLEFRWMDEAATRVAALVTEQVHLAEVERTQRPGLISKGMEVIPAQFPAMMYFWSFWGNYHTEPETLLPESENPLLNRDVRQAMAKAVNRKAIAEAFLPGSEVRIPVFWGFDENVDEGIWPGIINQEWYDKVEEQFGYDPEAAKALLVKAGYPDGFEFDLILSDTSGLPEAQDITQAMELDFKKIGLKPRMVAMENSKIRSMRRAREIHNAISGTANTSFSMYTLNTYYNTKGSVHAFAHPDIDALFDELGETVDGKKRTEILQDIGDICFEQICNIPMFGMRPEIMVNPKFVEEYVYPGFINSYFTHLEYIKVK